MGKRGQLKKQWGGKREGAGRPKGSYTVWIPENQIIQKLPGILRNQLPRPPRCLCGVRDYRYKIEGALVLVRCNNCHEIYVFDIEFNIGWQRDQIRFIKKEEKAYLRKIREKNKRLKK